MKTYQTASKGETWKVAKDLLQNLDNNVILLQGELGAGKTTFAQGVLTALGAEGPFTSPTFVIMKHYKLKGKSEKLKGNSKFQIQNSKFSSIFHFDCYRVGEDDILELGWEEIIADPKNLVLVEWPERIKKIWPRKYTFINFEIADGDKRKLKITNKK